MTHLKSWRRSVKQCRGSLTPVRSFSRWNDVCLVVAVESLTEDETVLKEFFFEQGLPDWSRRDFQWVVQVLEGSWIVRHNFSKI